MKKIIGLIKLSQQLNLLPKNYLFNYQMRAFKGLVCSSILEEGIAGFELPVRFPRYPTSEITQWHLQQFDAMSIRDQSKASSKLVYPVVSARIHSLPG